MEKTFGTTDLYTICALVAHGHELLKIVSEPEPGKRSVKRFLFKDTPELQKTVMDHFNGKLMVSTREFANAIDNVKRQIRYQS